ncbi:MAG: sugar nucleotide-binding protein [Acidimicrobiales bacterium]
MRLLVTGASGFVGRAVVAAALASSAVDEVIGTRFGSPPPPGTEAARWEVVDLADPDAGRRLVAATTPDAVVHTAYVEGGPLLDPVTALAPGALAAATAGRARFVHVSTDVVFAGDVADGTTYVEDDPVGPVHAYGRAKAEAERRVLAADPAAVVARTSLVYDGGSAPEAWSRHERQALAVAAGEVDMAFFDDEWRAPIAVVDLAGTLLALAADPDPCWTGIHHVAGPEPVTRLDLARRMVAAHGGDPRRVPGASVASVAAPRPRCCVLVATRGRPSSAPVVRGVGEVLGAAPLPPPRTWPGEPPPAAPRFVAPRPAE